jgi:hypothetical protein
MTSSTLDRPKCASCSHKYGTRVHGTQPPGYDVFIAENGSQFLVPWRPFCSAQCALNYARAAYDLVMSGRVPKRAA